MTPEKTAIMLGLIILSACATEKEIHEGMQEALVENCKQNSSPYDPELDYCIDKATVPYDVIESDRKDTD